VLAIIPPLFLLQARLYLRALFLGSSMFGSHILNKNWNI